MINHPKMHADVVAATDDRTRQAAATAHNVDAMRIAWTAWRAAGPMRVHSMYEPKSNNHVV